MTEQDTTEYLMSSPANAERLRRSLEASRRGEYTEHALIEVEEDEGEINPGRISLRWSEEDAEYVATHSGFPSMSWLDADPVEAVRGIVQAINEAREDIERDARDE